MIALFRKLRHNLLAKSTIKNYTLYAIGEIFLVVIGILIALQINTWNQNHSERILEKKTLKEILSSLEDDMLELDSEINLFGLQSASIDTIFNRIRNKGPITDSLGYHIAFSLVASHFNPNYSGYQFLQTKGLDLILNDSLRSKISRLYTTDYDYYYQYQQERIAITREFDLELAKSFYTLKAEDILYRSMKPFSKDSFHSDKRILANFQNLSYRLRLITSRAVRLRAKIEDLMLLIQAELR